MDKRIKKSGYLILVLALCLFSVTAFASTSTATISLGTVSSTAGARVLENGDTLTGYVQSTYQYPGSSANLFGYMYTKGSTYTHLRDTKSVFSGTTNFTPYTCTDPQGGTYWAKLYTSEGNHNGTASVTNGE